MLLEGTINDLKRLCERMNHTNSSHLRRTLIQCEKLARTQEQILFLKTCRKENCFPKTIENINFPQFLKADCMKNATRYLKKFILRKLLRHIYREQRLCKLKCSGAIQRIFDDYDWNQAIKIASLCETAFQRSVATHKKRLSKKYENLKPRQQQPQAPTTKIEDTLVTDLTGVLEDEEVRLLAKGPKFAITKKWNEEAKVDVQANFCKVAYQLRWRSQEQKRHHEKVKEPIQRYPESNSLHLPTCEDQELEFKLKECYLRVKKVISSVEKEIKPNISKNERKIINRLKTKAVVCLPSDKGGEFCIVNTEDYNTAALKHLHDGITYRRVPSMTAKTIESKINKTWKRIGAEEKISAHITKSYVSTNTDLPKFYHLVKTHKEGDELKIRPIVSNINGPTKKISWLLSRILEPVYQLVPTHLENSQQLINDIRNQDATARLYPYPFSLDVRSLFTSIPGTEAVATLEKKLRHHKELQLPLKIENICELVQVVLRNTYFSFKDNVYEQVSGLPMGNSISSILSTIYMDAIEQQSLRQLRIGIYRRYVDDIFITTTTEEEAHAILDFMNAQNEHIKFDIEHSSNSTLSLLDFSVNMKNITFSFYKKHAKKDIFVNFTSAMPTRSKIQCARNEIKRIRERCSTTQQETKHQKNFENLLATNGYPEEAIANIKKPAKRRRPNKQQCSNYVYFKFPFVNDRIYHKVQNIFRSVNLPVRVYDTNYTLRKALQPKKSIERVQPQELCHEG